MDKAENAKKLAEMIRLYEDEKMSLGQIARIFNVSRQAVHDRFTRAGIQMRTPGARKGGWTIDRETLHCLYVEQELPIYKIAQSFRVNFYLIVSELERHSIPRRAKGYEARQASPLNKIEVGESVLVSYASIRQPYVNYYLQAVTRGIKVSVKQIGSGQARITRLG